MSAALECNVHCVGVEGGVMSGHIEAAVEQPLRDGLSTRYEVWHLANGLEIATHLGGMDARVRWRILEPRLAELAAALDPSDQLVSETVLEELAMLMQALDDLRADLN